MIDLSKDTQELKREALAYGLKPHRTPDGRVRLLSGNGDVLSEHICVRESDVGDYLDDVVEAYGKAQFRLA